MKSIEVSFVTSAYSLDQLPADTMPEIAFAGRSNVGKSSLLNTLFNRKNIVKVSGRPGKTQALNYFLVHQRYYFVDLPGYGFARVSKRLQSEWGTLITAYLQHRRSLRGVVVVMDIRHGVKESDRALLGWLRGIGVDYLLAYTKADKLSANQIEQKARILDAGHGVSRGERVIFSAHDKRGREELHERIETLIGIE